MVGFPIVEGGNSTWKAMIGNTEQQIQFSNLDYRKG